MCFTVDNENLIQIKYMQRKNRSSCSALFGENDAAQTLLLTAVMQ